MNLTRTIAKNTSILMFSQLLTWGLSLLLVVFQPRYLGPTGVGQLHLAVSLWAIAGILISFGTEMFLTKEIARNPSKTAELVSTTIFLRVGMYVLGTGAVILYAHLAGYTTQTIQVIYIIGVGNFMEQFSGPCRAALQGLEQMSYPALADIGSKMVNVFLAIPLLLLGFKAASIAWTVVAGGLVGLIICVFALSRLQPLRFYFNGRFALTLLRASVPYLLVYLLLAAYMQMDIIIISLLVNEETIGWYGAADVLFGTLLFVPTAFMTAAFPALSRLYANNSDSLTRLMQKSFDFLLILGVPIGLGTVVIANPVVQLLYGPGFANSGPVLAVFGVVLILTYQNVLLGRFFISIDRQNTWTAVMAVATIATIPLDLWLVPWCQTRFGNGAIGGGLSFVATELGMMVAGLWLLPKGTLDRATAWRSLRVLLAGGVMAVVIWPLQQYFVAIPIVAGAVVYTLAIVLLQLLSPEDWALLRMVTEGGINRLRRLRPQPAKVEG